MKHLDTLNVAFISSVARSFNNEKYYRNNFMVADKLHSAKASEDYAGKAGSVQFLAKGESFGDRVIERDCFTLVGITTASAIKSANETLAELTA